MTRTYIAKWLRDRVAEAARHRCGYCLSAESVVGTRMEIDHIVPRSAGGLTAEEVAESLAVQLSDCATF